MQTDTEHRPVVIALHSSGAGARQWEPYRALSDPHWRFVAPDLIGYDDAAPWSVGGSTSLESEASRIAALFDAVGDAPVHLVGHSYGGSVALQVALDRPHRIASLTLYEPVRFALLRGHDEGAWREIVGAGRRIGALALGGQLHASAQVFVDYWSGAGAWQRLSPTRQEAVARRMPKVQAEFEALFDDPISPAAYARLRMPLHLVCGSSSPAPARRVAERLAQLHPRARLSCWAGAGHMAPLTQVERFARLLPGMRSRVQSVAA